MSTRQQIHLGKIQGNNLYNVGDVKEITYIGTTLIKETEWGLSRTFRRLKKWNKWEETCQGFMHPWTTRMHNIRPP